MNQNRAMMEAYEWDAAAALKWARGLKNWPRRRFRLEESRAGNSKLLLEKVAKTMQASYGGKVVELIPPGRDPNAKQTVYEVAAEDMPKCPHCRESKSKPCRSPQGGQRMPHSKREKLAEKRSKKT